jgi:hypothetical protein
MRRDECYRLFSAKCQYRCILANWLEINELPVLNAAMDFVSRLAKEVSEQNVYVGEGELPILQALTPSNVFKIACHECPSA